MLRSCLPMLLLIPLAASAQASQISSGATVYIEPMNGYETYLAAAFAKKHVPLTIVTNADKADFILQSTISHQTPSQPVVVVNNTVRTGQSPFADSMQEGLERGAAERASLGQTSASISMIDLRSSQIAFAYSAGKSGSKNQVQGTAEDCAKHLRLFIEKSRK